MTQLALQDIVELRRIDAPTLRPQAIAFDGTNLWIGSIETDRLYAIAPNTWTVTDEMSVPGKPYGLTVAGDELRVLLAQTAEDHRSIFRVVPGHGIRLSSAIPCPDDTGSHLSYDGDLLYVSQWYKKRIIALDVTGKPGTIVVVPHEVCGHTIVGGCFYCVTTDDETSGTYFLTRVDARGTSPTSVDLARIPFNARGLAFDGERFWTNDREIHQTVAFARPDSAA
jgi:sugar lactone lactonase YvrE